MIIPMKTLRKKAVCLLLCAIMAAGLAACATPAQTIVDPAARSDGKIYLESKLPVDFGDKNVRSMLLLPDGNFLALTMEYTEDENIVEACLLDAQGKQLSAEKLDPKTQNISEWNYGLDGKVYAFEMRYDMPEQPLEADATPTEATPTEATPTEATPTEATPTDATPTDAASSGVTSEKSIRGSTMMGPMEEPKSTLFLHRFTTDGKLESSLELTLPPDKSRNFYPQSMQVDEQGRAYLALSENDLMRFGPGGAFDKAFPMENIQRMVLLPGGDAVTMSYGPSGPEVRRVSLETNAEKYKLEGRYFENIVYNHLDECVYAYGNGRIERINDDGTTDIVAYMSDFSLMSPLVQIQSIMLDGNESIYFNVMKRHSEYDNLKAQLEQNDNFRWGNCELIMLKLADASEAPKRKQIVISVMNQDYNISQAASAFQSLHPDISVKVREILPQDSMMGIRDQDDYQAYIKKVNTEILTGKAADIIALAGLPFQDYQEKKILQDLSGYIQNDPEMNDENYFMNVIDGFKADGKQYVFPTRFSASYLVAPKGMNIPEAGFSLKQFIDFCDALPENKRPMSTGTAEGVFQTLVMPNMKYFMDKSAQLARLDSPEFIELLEACRRIGNRGISYPDGGDEAAWRQYREDIRKNAVFHEGYMYDFSLKREMLWQLDDDQEGLVLPYPGIDGPSWSYQPNEMYGINRSAKDKDVCWEFLKFLVSEEFLEMSSYGQITMNKKLNQKMSEIRIAIEARDGSRSSMSDGVREIEIPPLTQAEVDEVNAYLGRLTQPMVYDEKLISMLMEEMQPFFEGTKDAQTTAAALQSRVSMYLSE